MFRNAAVLLCTLFGALAGAPAASAADFTWAGAKGNWSDGTRWVGGVAPSGTVGALSFPAALCSTECPNPATDDVSGLTAATLLIRGAPHQKGSWAINGTKDVPLTLTSGIDAAFPEPGNFTSAAGSLYLPIVLGADNTWKVDDAILFAQGAFGVTGDHSLAFNLTNGASFGTGANALEVGPVTIGGGGKLVLNYGGGASSGPASLNGTNGNPVAVTGATLNSAGSAAVGALTATAATVRAFSGTLRAASASFDAASTLGLQFGGGPVFTGEHSRLTSTGAVDLGGATLDLYRPPELCTQPAGTVFTLVSTTGTLSGTFSNLPDGGVVDCSGPPGPGAMYARYDRTGPTRTVTLTVERNFTLVDGATGNWSVASNWVGNQAPSGARRIPTLSLGSGCGAAGCVNDLTGLTVDRLRADASSGTVSGNAITLGAGGLKGSNARLAVPITLSADQTWRHVGMMRQPSDMLVATGGLTGAAFELGMTYVVVQLGGANELAGVTADHTTLILGAGTSLNASSGNPVTMTDGEVASHGAAVGALRLTNSTLEVGQKNIKPTGSLSVTSLVLDPLSSVRFNIATGATGVGPGTDYGQLTTAGALDVSGMRMVLSGGVANAFGTCGPDAPVGTVYTLVSAQGALTGAFSNAPEGTKVNDCGGPFTGRSYVINYTAHTVTATRVAPGTPAPNPFATPTPTPTRTPTPAPDPVVAEKAQITSGLAAQKLPRTSDGKQAKFAIAADAFPAGTKLKIALRATKLALASAKTQPVGTKTLITTAGRAATVKVTLSSRARKRLRKKGRLTLTVITTATAPSGAKGSTTRKLTLRKK